MNDYTCFTPLRLFQESLEGKVGKRIKSEALEILKLMLTKNAEKRPSAETIMTMPYFEGLPFTVPLEDIKKSKQKQVRRIVDKQRF